MRIEGILDAEPLRDHLDAMMRGARGDSDDEDSFAGNQDEMLEL
jgi:hypothetical protein